MEGGHSWPQFEGLEARLEGCVARVEELIKTTGIEVVNLGLVDSPERAMEAGHGFRKADVDLIFLNALPPVRIYPNLDALMRSTIFMKGINSLNDKFVPEYSSTIVGGGWQLDAD